MRIEFLKEAISIANSNNFQESADEQFVSQAGISRQIKALENELGVDLFNRSTKNVQITEAGQLAMPYLEEMAKLYENLLYDTSDQRKAHKDTLRVAYSTTARLTDMTSIIAAARKEEHDVDYKFVSTADRQIARLVFQSKLDAGCVSQYDMPVNVSLASLKLMTDEILLAVRDDSPLAGKAVLSIQELQNVDFIAYREHAAANHKFLQLCQNAGFTPNISLYTTNCSDINKLVDAGFGVGIQMRSTYKIGMNLEPLRVCCIPLKEDTSIDYFLIYDQNNRKEALHDLVERVKEKLRIMNGGEDLS